MLRIAAFPSIVEASTPIRFALDQTMLGQAVQRPGEHPLMQFQQ
jgi:hypothetical protein